VNTLLDFSRIEARRMEAVYEPTDLAAFTAELASNFRSATDRAGLRLVVDCPPLGEAVFVDRDMWEKVVLNLLSNAFKFTFEGELAVTLRLADGRAVLSVRDTGTGISAGEIPHLFERFYRVKGARARTHEGTGIGLSLVQELVRFHGGSVSVDSVPGQGSIFTVSIPTGKAHLPAERIAIPRSLVSTSVGASPFLEEALRWFPDHEPPVSVSEDIGSSGPEGWSAPVTSPSERPKGVDTASGRRPRILWADDNADMREYVSRLLREHWSVEAAADGKSALEAARADPPDLVLADVMMPGLDGFALLRALRDDPGTSTVPVILLSARAGEEARVEGLQAGADDYVIKPFTARELMARVGTHLTLARARREAERQAQAAQAEAEAASRAKDVFLAMLSHELRQPMSSIVGWVRMLRSGEVTAAMQQRGLETLERNAHTLTRLIDDLLDVSSIVAGKIQLRLRAVDLRHPIEAALEVARPGATAKGIELERILDADAPSVFGDPDRLQQVVWNLLSNAVKFTPDGGRVTVRLRRTSSRVIISVGDSGCGIRQEFLPRIFDRFTQATEETTRAVRGLGLGLAIVRHLVELHGGTVSAESAGEGRGSMFTVSFPIASTR
jgi:signal transduction histidine kinase